MDICDLNIPKTLILLIIIVLSIFLIGLFTWIYHKKFPVRPVRVILNSLAAAYIGFLLTMITRNIAFLVIAFIGLIGLFINSKCNISELNNIRIKIAYIIIFILVSSSIIIPVNFFFNDFYEYGCNTESKYCELAEGICAYNCNTISETDTYAIHPVLACTELNQYCCVIP